MDIRFLPAAHIIPDARPLDSTSPQSFDESAETFHQTLAAASAGGNKIADAAKQFEALIAGQVLKSVRDANQGGWLGNDQDQTGELTLEMAEQAFAQALASRGSFGIAKVVNENLNREHLKTASSGPAASHPQAPSNTEPVK